MQDWLCSPQALGNYCGFRNDGGESRAPMLRVITGSAMVGRAVAGAMGGPAA